VEEWAPLPDFEHYQVSSRGRVRRIAHRTHYRAGLTRARSSRHYEERLLPTRWHKGSLVVTIKREGKRQMVVLLPKVQAIFGQEAADAIRANKGIPTHDRDAELAATRVETEEKFAARFGSNALAELKLKH
jgi:hypothetical protein